MTTATDTTKKPTVLQRLSLYEIALEGKLIEGDGELTPETEARMDSLLLSGKPKIEAAALVIKELEASEDNAKKEAERLTLRRKSFERNAEGLKARVVCALDTPVYSGKVKTDRVTVYTQKAADSLSFEFPYEQEMFAHLRESHPDLVKVETVYSLNTEALKNIWAEEEPARQQYAEELAAYQAAMDAAENGEGCEIPNEPEEPQSQIPQVITVTEKEGRRFLQIR